MSSRSKRKMMQVQATGVMRGYSLLDLERAHQKGYDQGFEEGFKKSSKYMVPSFYTAILLALKEEFGFGQDEGIAVLNRIHNILVECICDQELQQRVLDEIGVEVDWDQPIEKARAKEPVGAQSEAFACADTGIEQSERTDNT